jgi:hypothetical protein
VISGLARKTDALAEATSSSEARRVNVMPPL